MQVVIDIDENLYTRLFDNGVEFNTDDKHDLERSVRHGKVLPRPHGRLIDADALYGRMYHEAFETDSELQKWESGCWIRYKMFENHIDDAPTIIEAESEDKK